MHKNSAKKLFYAITIKQAEIKEPPAVQAVATLQMTALYDESGANKIMLLETQIAEGTLASQKEVDEFNDEINTYTEEVIAGVQKDIPALAGRIFKGNLRLVG